LANDYPSYEIWIFDLIILLTEFLTLITNKLFHGIKFSDIDYIVVYILIHKLIRNFVIEKHLSKKFFKIFFKNN